MRISPGLADMPSSVSVLAERKKEDTCVVLNLLPFIGINYNVTNRVTYKKQNETNSESIQSF